MNKTKPMGVKITLEKSGGFAAIKRIINLEAEKLSEEEKKKLGKLIRDSHFFEITDTFAKPIQGADYLHYKLTIYDDKKERSIKLNPEMLPKILKKLVRYIEDRGT